MTADEQLVLIKEFGLGLWIHFLLCLFVHCVNGISCSSLQGCFFIDKPMYFSSKVLPSNFLLLNWCSENKLSRDVNVKPYLSISWLLASYFQEPCVIGCQTSINRRGSSSASRWEFRHEPYNDPAIVVIYLDQRCALVKAARASNAYKKNDGFGLWWEGCINVWKTHHCQHISYSYSGIQKNRTSRSSRYHYPHLWCLLYVVLC